MTSAFSLESQKVRGMSSRVCAGFRELADGDNNAGD